MSEQDDHIKQAANDLFDDLLIGADCLIGDSDALEFDDALSERIEACMRLRIRQAVDRVVPQPSLTPADLIALWEMRDEMLAVVDPTVTLQKVTFNQLAFWAGQLDALITRLSLENKDKK